MTTIDPRIAQLEALVINLQEYPADQSDEVLIAASNLGSQLKGLADAERLARVLMSDGASR